MRSVNTIIITFILCLFATKSFACKPFLIKRSYTTELLVYDAEVILIAKVNSIKPSTGFFASKTEPTFDYEMDVVNVLKGSKKEKTIQMLHFENTNVESREIGPAFGCKNKGGFKKDVKYLIFPNTNHPNAIKQIDGDSDAWLLEVMSAVEKLKK